MIYKMIVLDIDGTLTTSKKDITPATKEALLEIQQKGYKVVLASGRPTPGLARFAKELELAKYGSYTLSYNGAKIVNCKTGEIMYEKLLPNNVLPDLYDIAIEHGVGIMTYENDNVVTGTPFDKYMMLESRINNLNIRYEKNFKEYTTFPTHKCLMTGEHEVLQKAEEHLKKKYNSLLSIYFSEPFFLEIMPQNISKADSLQMLCNHLGMTSEEVICCGDGFNDISMIEFAGLGVAMENAQDIVKESADYITASNDNDGIVQVIRKFMK